MTDKPTVSIIMPIRNEAISIEHSLGAVLAQDYFANGMEILVVDGMSTDSTRDRIENLKTLYPGHSIRVLDNPLGIVSTAMNIGIKQAKGEIVVRVDGHTEITPSYIQECVTTLQRTGADNVGGRMDPNGKGLLGEAIALATSTPFGVGGSRFHYSNREEWVDTVYLGAWRREVFERVGKFDEEMVRNQDDEFNYRLRKHGGKILLNPAIRSQYTNRSSVKTLWRQYYQYGFWKVRVLQKHPSQMQWRQFVPPLFVAALLGGALLAPLSSIVYILWSSMLILYLLINLAASIWTAIQHGWRYLPLLPLIFAILHISYGLGFLVGLIRFVNRWSPNGQAVIAAEL